MRLSRVRRLLGPFVALLLALPSTAAPPLPLAERLERAVKKARIPPSGFGASVVLVDGQGDPELWSHRSGEPMTPASNLKLFTTAAALERLGPDFRLGTELRFAGKVASGELAGNLVVVGHGDPGISGRFDPDADPLAIFRDWARALAAKGIRKVSGDLVLDDTYFDREFRAATWPPAGTGHWYQAPVGALSFEDNCVGVRVRPTRPRQKALVELVPPLGAFRIAADVKTVGKKGKRAGFVVSRERGIPVVVVRGSVRVGESPDLVFVTVDDPALWFGAALRETLEREGIAIAGRTRRVGAGESAAGDVVARHETRLLDAVRVCNKRSQNFFAESLVKVLGREKRGEGSWRAGLAEIDATLAALGLDGRGRLLEDGSGISRGSLVSARQFTALLARMQHHPLADAYRDSLCAAGEDGCGFGRRLAGNDGAQGNVWAKTGTIAGVRSLSGYARTREGKLYAWSLLLNAPLPSDAAIRRFGDDFLSALLDGG